MAKKSSRRKGSKGRPVQPESRFAAHRPTLERVLFVLALLGVLVTVHLYIQQGRGFDQGCWGFNPGDNAANATFDCEAVTESEAGKIFGLSNAIWGFLFYALLAGISAIIALGSEQRRLVLKQARAAIIGVGFLYSLYLSYMQSFVIGELCALCLTSAGIVLLLTIVQAIYLFGPSSDEQPVPTTTKASPKLYGSMVAVVILLLLGDFAYFSSLERAVITPELPVAEARAINVETQCAFNEEYQPFSNLDALIQDSDAVRGNPDAPLTIYEYFDPNCPHCKSVFPVMNALEKKYEERLRFVYKPVAIIGAQSDLQVAALRAAAEAGKFKEMLALQFETQKPSQGHTMSELEEFANQIGMDGEDMARRIRDGEYRSAMMRENRLFGQMNLRSVPRIIFNGRVVASRSRYVECFDHFIEEALGETTPAAEASTADTAAVADAPAG